MVRRPYTLDGMAEITDSDLQCMLDEFVDFEKDLVPIVNASRRRWEQYEVMLNKSRC